MDQITEILKKIKNDKLRVGLAVEGGGLRGVISLALLSVLKDLGLRDQILSLSGTSSGAINAAYFLGDQLEDCLQLYREMASPKFIQPMKWPNAMNLDYLFNDMICNQLPLNCEKIFKSHVDFYITVTSLEDGVSTYLNVKNFEKKQNLMQALRASTSAPLFCTNYETIKGIKYNDGHVQMAIPYQPHNLEKVDYILCLQTQKKGYKKTGGLLNQLHQRVALRNYNQAYKKSFYQSKDLYNQQLKSIQNNPKLISLQIEPEDFVVSKLCQDPKNIDRCFQATRDRFAKNSN